jgi:hypothetical protein
MPVRPGPLPQMELWLPYEMLTADVGVLNNGKHFITITDRFSGLVAMYDLKIAGTSGEIIECIEKFITNNFTKLKQIYWDNASNFTSHKIDAWAIKHSILLENLVAYHPSGNLFVETNIK